MTEPAPPGVVRLDDYRWMLPQEGGMRVPGILFADRALLDRILSDQTPIRMR